MKRESWPDIAILILLLFGVPAVLTLLSGVAFNWDGAIEWAAVLILAGAVPGFIMFVVDFVLTVVLDR